jgi:hypothetical protein
MHYIACSLLANCLPAAAFHAGNLFDKPPGAGGAGGVFYTGAPAERGWTCTACHRESPLSGEVDAAPKPGLIKLQLGIDPPLGDRYAPDRVYTFTIDLLGEHNGLGQSANFNAIAASFADDQGMPAGEVSGFAPDDLYQGGPATIADAGKKPNNTHWSFTWTAPPAGTGAVSLHIGAGDGNAAGATGGGSTLTDPWGDDVFVGSLSFGEGTQAARRRAGPLTTGLVGLAAVVLFWRRRRGCEPPSR